MADSNLHAMSTRYTLIQMSTERHLIKCRNGVYRKVAYSLTIRHLANADQALQLKIVKISKRVLQYEAACLEAELI